MLYSPRLWDPGLWRILFGFWTLWWSAESELVLRQLRSAEGGDRYGPEEYGDVSIRLSIGLERIGPTEPTLRPLSLYTVVESTRLIWTSSKLLRTGWEKTKTNKIVFYYIKTVTFPRFLKWFLHATKI